MVETKADQPFFTIGVTTYNRHDLLRQALKSILAQTYSNFEVIVGNDYTAETLSPDLIGVLDPRIRYLNHPVNLREVGNMNALLTQATGRYFTWLADDDLYAPNFLEAMYCSLNRNKFPLCSFSAYELFFGVGSQELKVVIPIGEELLTGCHYLRRYFDGKFPIMGTCGFFDTIALKQMGGVEELTTSGVGLYGEYIFLVKCAMFDSILFVDAPLVKYRSHESCWTGTNVELDKYLVAGQELIRRSAKILRHPTLVVDLNKNLLALCKLHLSTFSSKCAAHEIAEGKSGPGMLLRALTRFSEETAKIHQLFISEGGRKAFWRFTWMSLKGYYIILGMLTMNWLRKL